MSLPTNNKKTTKDNKNQKAQGKGSKFIQSSSTSKPLTAAKKVRSTGTRGS